MKKALVLGGGIGGVEAASLLSKSGFRVELVSNRDYFYIYPLSIWIPVDRIKPKEIKLDIKHLAHTHDYTFIKDEVLSISKNKVILKENGEKVDWDYLVIAMGGSKMSHKGLENTYSLCGNPDDALKLRDKIKELVSRGHGKIAVGFGGNPVDPSGIRGGPAFEFLFNLHDYLNRLGIRDKFEITFFAPMKKPGVRLGEKALQMIDQMIAAFHIKKITGKKIDEFVKDGVILEDGEKIEADAVMFIPAVDGHSVIKKSDLPKNDAGFIIIDDTTQVEGLENIYAIGDAAEIVGPDWRAKQGHLAEAMARVCVHNITHKKRIKVESQKSYKKHLSVMCLMDMGKIGGGLVYKCEKQAFLLQMPTIGHYLKRLWGIHFKLVKLKKIPKVPYLN